jgi:hypothetical protein
MDKVIRTLVMGNIRTMVMDRVHTIIRTLAPLTRPGVQTISTRIDGSTTDHSTTGGGDRSNVTHAPTSLPIFAIVTTLGKN